MISYTQKRRLRYYSRQKIKHFKKRKDPDMKKPSTKTAKKIEMVLFIKRAIAIFFQTIFSPLPTEEYKRTAYLFAIALGILFGSIISYCYIVLKISWQMLGIIYSITFPLLTFFIVYRVITYYGQWGNILPQSKQQG